MRMLAGLFAALLVSLPAPAAPERRFDLLLVSLDTTRRDHLSTYGYARPTSPALDRLAAQSVVFENAFAQQTKTNPSHASMFTGMYPHEHGSVDNTRSLGPQHVTLAERLRDAGYANAAFVSGYTLARSFGLDQGFDVYDDAFPRTGRRRGEDTIDRALGWLGLPRAGPAFLFVHFFDAHGPYRPPEGYAGRFAAEKPGPVLRNVPPYQLLPDVRTLGPYESAYDESIRYIDDQLGRLLEAVDLSRTVVVVLADHGESLSERHVALTHGASVFDEQIRIPLVVHVPGRAPAHVEALVETVDLLPTLLDALELEPGKSILEPGSKDKVFSSSVAKTSAHADRKYVLDEKARIHSVRTRGWKLVRYPGMGIHYTELYDLLEDPGEKHNVADRFPERRTELEEALRTWLSTTREPAPQVDERSHEHLRSLGYID